MRDQVELSNTVAGARRWHAVATHAGYELVAMQDLAEQDFEVFLPWLAERVKHPRKGVVIHQRPAFGCYLFAHFDHRDDRWKAIKGARGVLHVLCNEERPIAAAPGEIEGLLRLAGDGDGLLHIGPNGQLCSGKPPVRRSRFAAGDRVEVAAGLLEMAATRVTGQYVGGKNGLAWLLVDIMGGPRVVKLSEALLVAA
jgi:transcription antitermination factor NusG